MTIFKRYAKNSAVEKRFRKPLQLVSAPVMISCLALSTTLSSCVAYSSDMAASFVPSSDCTVGIFQGSQPDFISVTKRSSGYMFTYSDGRLVRSVDKNSNIECADDSIRIDGEDIWKKRDIVQTDTRFSSDGVMLAGRLMQPYGANAQTPLVVFAHGSEESGWLDRARDPYQMLGRNISVFVYDKRGTGLSEGLYSQNFPSLSDDLVAASHEAKRLAGDRFGRFGIVGLSQGGWIAPLAADRAKADFIGIGYGLVVDIREEDASQVQVDLEAAGYSGDVLIAAKRITDATGRIAASSYVDGIEDLIAAQEQYAGQPWLSVIEGEYTGVFLSMSPEVLRGLKVSGIPAFDRLNVDWDLNPMEVLDSVSVPQLWALAGADQEAPIDLTLERLSTLRQNGKDIKIYVFPETDHGIVKFIEVKDGTRQYTDVANGFYDLMADWAKGDLGDVYGTARKE